MFTSLGICLITVLGIQLSFGDITHLLPQDYSTAIFHQIPPQQIQFFQNYAPPAPATPPPIIPTTTSTEFTLPEVIDNRQAKDIGHFIPLRQHYLPPSRPNFEVSKKPQPTYLPPVRDDDKGYNYEPPAVTSTKKPDPIVVFDTSNTLTGYNYQVPQFPLFSTPAPLYLPPVKLTKPHSLENNLADHDLASEFLLKIKEMRCLQHHGGYFRSVLQVNNNLVTNALIESDIYDKRCKVKHSRDTIIVDISEVNFKLCGVKDCGSDLCLRMRFPVIPGMRTANDGIVTLHCKSQERVAAKIFALKMGVGNDIQARSLGAYFHGGSQNTFRTHVELLRKSSTGFTRSLKDNEAVQLGEDLLLRAHVLSGDGWNYTKLTDVTLQRSSPTGDSMNALELINSLGCVNPTLLTICPQAPKFDPPLGHMLIFKAVMFQGMQSGDEVVLSMRISGCLDARDCELQAQQCYSDGSNLRRRKRNTKDSKTAANNSSQEASEISRISFRVTFEENMKESELVQQEMQNIKIVEQNLALGTTLFFLGALICLGILMRFKLTANGKI